MKNTLLQTAAIVLVSVACATGAHLLRPDKKAKIPFVGDYPEAFTIRDGAPSPNGAPALPAPGDVPSTPPQPAPPADGAGPPAPQTTAVEPAPSAPTTLVPAHTTSEYVDPDGVIREITLEEAFEHFDVGVTFIDARRTKAYEEGHIRGAKSMSVWEGDFDDKLGAFAATADLGLPYVVYCMSESCEDSHRLAERMKQVGFTVVMVFRGGFPAWSAAGNPVEKGPERAEDTP